LQTQAWLVLDMISTHVSQCPHALAHNTVTEWPAPDFIVGSSVI
jgi:hypothetical protein